MKSKAHHIEPCFLQLFDKNVLERDESETETREGGRREKKEEKGMKGKKRGEVRVGDKELENIEWHNKVKHLKP